MKINFIRSSYIRFYSNYKQEIFDSIDRCLSKGNLILGDDVERFEMQLARLSGAKYAIGVGSGTDALIISLKALGIKPGDEVITSAHTFWATLEAIIHCGAMPVLVDIKQDGTIITDLERYINGKTKAIIPVHIAGAICDMTPLKELAEEYSLKIIEDSAQAIGSKLQGDVACFSFYPAKILGCYGDGGAIVTNSESVDLMARQLRNHGGKPTPMLVGYTSRLDNIQAAVLNVKLKYLKENLERRKEIAQMYDEGLEKYFHPKENPVLTLPYPREIYQDYVVRLSKRNELRAFLEEKGIETMVDEYPFPREYLKTPVAISFHNTGLRLPMNDRLTNEEVEYVIINVKEFLGK